MDFRIDLTFELWVLDFLKIVNFIEKLQNKPKETRQRILWFAVAICMFVVFLLWIFSLKYSLRETAKNSENNNIIPQGAKESFQEFKKQAPTIRENIKAGIGNLFQQEQSEENPFESNNTTQDNNSE